MKKLLIALIVITFCLSAQSALATEYVDDDGVCGGNFPCHTTISAAYSAASTGETILVYDGTYDESELTVAKSNLTFQSVTEYGAKWDGTSAASDGRYAVDVTASGVNFIGIQFQNWTLNSTTCSGFPGSVYGIVNIRAGSWEIKYCRFYQNYRPDNGSYSAYLVHTTSGGGIFRGNKFESNSIKFSAVVASWGSSNLYELNYMPSSNWIASDGWAIYHKEAWHLTGATFQYNYFGHNNRWREGHDFDIHDNIFRDGFLQLHDACQTRSSCGSGNFEDIDEVDGYYGTGNTCSGNYDENHEVYKNTFYSNSVGLDIIRQDGINIHNNLFVDIGSTGAIYDEFDGVTGCDTGDIVITNNRRDNVTTWLNSLSSGEYTESGTANCISNFSSSTGLHDCTQGTYGANLKVNVWPYTDKDGGALQTDYPYGGPDTTPPQVSSASIAENGTTVTINFTEYVNQAVEAGDFNLDCTPTSGDNVSLSYSSGSGSSSLIFTSASTIQSGETCNLDYIGSTDDIEDLSGNDLATFSNTAVTNNSIQGGTSDTTAPAIASITFSPDPEICEDGINQQFSISVTATDANSINCGILCSHTSCVAVSSYEGEAAFDIDTPATYVAMECGGAGVYQCASGSTWSYQPNLDCDDDTRYYSVACWDTSGNVTTFSAATRLEVTPPSTQASSAYGQSPTDQETDVSVDTTIQITVSNASGGITTGSIGMSLNGTDYVCTDSELDCTGSETEYDVTLTPPTTLASRTRYTVAFSAYGLSTNEVWEFTTAPIEALGQRFTLLNGYLYN